MPESWAGAESSGFDQLKEGENDGISAMSDFILRSSFVKIEVYWQDEDMQPIMGGRGFTKLACSSSVVFKAFSSCRVLSILRTHE